MAPAARRRRPAGSTRSMLRTGFFAALALLAAAGAVWHHLQTSSFAVWLGASSTEVLEDVIDAYAGNGGNETSSDAKASGPAAAAVRRRRRRRKESSDTSSPAGSAQSAVAGGSVEGFSTPREAAAPVSTDGEAGSAASASAVQKELVHVCFCWDDRDGKPHSLQTLLVAINSTLVNAADKRRMVFHVITTRAAAEPTRRALVQHLPDASIQAHYNEQLQGRISKLMTVRKDSGARKVLSSAFNFAPFYLDEFLQLPVPGNAVAGGDSANSRTLEAPRRLIYLDTDIVVAGDLAELHDMDIGNHAVAAVEDCSQTFDRYIDFKRLKEKGLERPGVEKKACVYNRGVFLMDVARWRELQVTKDIEVYMSAYRDASIYRFGVSQPPWLLGVRQRYFRLGAEWNCRGLGRDLLAVKELDVIRASGGWAWEKVKALGLKQHGVKASQFTYRPFVSTCSAKARVLHFNGRLKPWDRRSWMQNWQAPMCLQSSGKKSSSGFVECMWLWKAYISDKAEDALQDEGTPLPRRNA
eukprot:TRINITY_DN38134_c0_g1_i1.p1 TRINITY_DN38134_c0_g1~~TRINITY_DN38134_c0_g1_i1.p1  ORF type:complete len:558 (+),score=124.35 TRINITY_DN38134_c0_g1_i1:98-1675(+)